MENRGAVARFFQLEHDTRHVGDHILEAAFALDQRVFDLPPRGYVRIKTDPPAIGGDAFLDAQHAASSGFDFEGALGIPVALQPFLDIFLDPPFSRLDPAIYNAVSLRSPRIGCRDPWHPRRIPAYRPGDCCAAPAGRRNRKERSRRRCFRSRRTAGPVRCSAASWACAVSSRSRSISSQRASTASNSSAWRGLRR